MAYATCEVCSLTFKTANRKPRRFCSIACRGKSESYRLARNESLRNSYDSEKRERVRAKTIEQFSDPAAREKTAAKAREQWSDPERRAALIEAQNRGKQSMSPEAKKEIHERIGNAHRGMKRPPGTGEKIAAAARKRWASYSREETLAICMKGVEAACKAHPTTIELIVGAVLDELGVDYVFNKKFGPYMPDYRIEDPKLIIECDGEYWHRNEDPVKRAERDAYFASHGYDVIHLTEDKIRSGELDSLVQALSC